MNKTLTSILSGIAILASGVAAGAAVGGDSDAATRDDSSESTKAPARHADRLPGNFDAQDFKQIGDGTFRVWGSNRYATAAAISEFSGWGPDNTYVVFIAQGNALPDALAVGPSTFELGPLLLVEKTKIPKATKDELAILQPCYIQVVGGTAAVSNSVVKALDTYTRPELCE